MRYPKRVIHILFALVIAFSLVGGCTKTDPAPKATPDAKKEETPKPPEVIAEENYGGLKVRMKDTVIIDFSVKLPNYLYFNGPQPVKVMIPGNVPFEFEKKVYAQTGKPKFPMHLKFEVPRPIDLGVYEIPLAVKLMYCNKADDICLIRDYVTKVEFMVVKTGGGIAQTHHLEKYMELQ